MSIIESRTGIPTRLMVLSRRIIAGSGPGRTPGIVDRRDVALNHSSSSLDRTLQESGITPDSSIIKLAVSDLHQARREIRRHAAPTRPAPTRPAPTRPTPHRRPFYQAEERSAEDDALVAQMLAMHHVPSHTTGDDTAANHRARAARTGASSSNNRERPLRPKHTRGRSQPERRLETRPTDGNQTDDEEMFPVPMPPTLVKQLSDEGRELLKSAAVLPQARPVTSAVLECQGQGTPITGTPITAECERRESVVHSADTFKLSRRSAARGCVSQGLLHLVLAFGNN